MSAPTNDPHFRASNARFVYLLLLVITFLVLAVKAMATQWRHPAEDFHYFYGAANAMRHGQDIFAATDGHYIYPPLFAFVFQPLSILSERTAALIWTLISVGLALTAVIVASKAVAPGTGRVDSSADTPFPWQLAFLSTVLISNELDASFVYGQTDSIILLAFALAWRWMNRRPLFAGIAVGFAANIKYLSLIFVPYFVAKRNWRAVGASVVAFFFFMVLPAIELGFRTTADDTAASYTGLGRMVGLTSENVVRVKILRITSHRSVSITSAVFRWTRDHASSDLIATALVLIIFALFLVAVVAICRHHKMSIFSPRSVESTDTSIVTNLELPVIVLVALAFSPQTTTRHMVLLQFVYLVAVALFLSQSKRLPKLLLAFALALMVIALSFPPMPSQVWSDIAAPSWCAMFLVLTITWVGARALPSERVTCHGSPAT